MNRGITNGDTVALSNSYLETKVLTARPQQLHLFVVEAALRQARAAETALHAGDYEAAHEALGISRDLVAELIAGLNRDHQPELVDRMQALFVFVFRTLAAADLHHDTRRVRDAIRVLEVHQRTWLDLIERLQDARPQGLAVPPEAAASGRPGRSWEA